MISRLWFGRLLIGLVTAWNMQAALSFMFDPAAFAPGFELRGIPGMAAVRGVGILFLMWNVPYIVALLQPVRYRLIVIIACLMQAIGFIGESFIWLTLPQENAILRVSILRFMVFDGIGLILILMAFWLVRQEEAR
jgi:hypothetical protein